MIVSARGQYALRLMIALAGSEDLVSLREIATERGIPHKYAESIMTALAKAGLVEGSRGKNGGYRLARAPKDCGLAEILSVTETSLAVSNCTDRTCPRAETCPTLPVWKGLEEVVNAYLSRFTLQDLLENGHTMPE